MNYLKIYYDIIDKAKNENRKKIRKNQKNYIYYENHHITPKCLGGLDNELNLVLLTAKEHYVAHKLLTFIYNNKKIALAFHRMTFDKKGNHNISSRDFAYAKEIVNSTSTPNETLLKQSNAAKLRIGEKNNFFGKHHTQKTKDLLREKSKITSSGEKNGMFGKHHTKKTKAKQSQKHIGKKASIETKQKQSQQRTGELNSNAKLTLTKVNEIKNLLKTDISIKDLAIKYSVSLGTIHHIKTGISWKNN